MAAAAATTTNPVLVTTTNPVVVLGPKYIARHPVDLTLSEKTGKVDYKGTDFKVMDSDGVPIFQVQAKPFSMHERRFMKNDAGVTLVSVEHKMMTMHARWEAFRGESSDDKDLIFTARKSSLLQFKQTPMDVFLAGNTEEQVPDFRVEGSFSKSSCTVFLGNTNTIIAQMKMYMNSVTIYPNVDHAFIIALFMILDVNNYDPTSLKPGTLAFRFVHYHMTK